MMSLSSARAGRYSGSWVQTVPGRRLLYACFRPRFVRPQVRPLIDGTDVSINPQEIRRKIGFLSGNTGLYGRLTAREMAVYFGRLYGMKKEQIDQRIEKLFNLLDMNEFANARNEKLSTGMKQKVSIARSVLHDPPVMIFDEPTNGLGCHEFADDC